MLAQTVRDTIRADISDAKYQPGAKLNEVKAAAYYGVSRNTLREAFAMLAAERLVERVPHRGVFIATPDLDYVTDLYRARAALEPAGALWGDKLDAARLLEVTTEALAAAERGDNATVSHNNQLFHQGVVAACGSPSLNAEMDNLLARMRLTFLLVLRVYPTIHGDYVHSNAHIARLLADDQRVPAATALHRSLNETCAKIISILEQAG